MKPLIFTFPGNEHLAGPLARRLDAEPAKFVLRRFPDGESYLRIDTPVKGRAAILLCTLDRPDEKMIPILFLAETARELGASRIVLAAPYLAYMRQDRRFQPGEGVSAVCFARLLSGYLDRLVTVDPHLHRIDSLDEIYSIPTRVIHAAPAISGWIRDNVKDPLLIGPDRESAQWVSEVAERVGAPHLVLEKVRRGDREVKVLLPESDLLRERTPILLDDIVSTARTLIETIGHLARRGLPKPICIAIHPVFAGRADDDLKEAGADRVVTCNTIAHPTNAIDLSGLLAGALRETERDEAEGE